MVSYRVEELNSENTTDWEILNQKSPYGSFFHTVRWKAILDQSIGAITKYFLVYEDGEAVALCPVCHGSLKGLNTIGPPPCSSEKHIIVSEPSNKAVLRLILKKGIQYAKESRSAFLLLVNTNQTARDSMNIICHDEQRKMTPFPLDGNLILDLNKHDPKEIWNDAFTSKGSQRKYIKRFERDGFYVRESRSDEDLTTFYRYYAENMRMKGVIPYRFLHFERIFDEYSIDEVRMTLLQRGETTAGAMISFLYPPRKSMYLHYMALNRDIPSTYHPPYALYWDAIKYAFKHDISRVSFGISTKDSSNRSYQIKADFGCQYYDVYPGLVPMNRIFDLTYRGYEYAKKKMSHKIIG